jgi:flagellar hook-length control protein FliK
MPSPTGASLTSRRRPTRGHRPGPADPSSNPQLADTAGNAPRQRPIRGNAASGENAGKRPELNPDGPRPTASPAIHAAALANLRRAPQPPSTAPHARGHPAGSPGWPEEVGNRVSWMVGQHESQAELTLTPPQLGKIEVSITVSGDQTSAQFVTATPAARELIEQSLPRLREILEQSGISLGQTDVGTSGSAAMAAASAAAGAAARHQRSTPARRSGSAARDWLIRSPENPEMAGSHAPIPGLPGGRDG